MAGGRGKGTRGKAGKTVWGALVTVLKDLREEGGVFNRHPEPWSRPRNQHGFQMGKPRLAELEVFAQDHLARKCQSWDLGICPSFGFSLVGNPPLMAGSREHQMGGCFPGLEPPACKVPAPSFHQADAQQLTLQSPQPRKGFGSGVPAGPDQRACSAAPLLHFASSPPAHPASASCSLLLIWFLSRMITFSNNKTRGHFLTADGPTP